MRMASFKHDRYRQLPPEPTPPPGPQILLPFGEPDQPASSPRDRMPDWADRTGTLPERDAPRLPTPDRPADPLDGLDLDDLGDDARDLLAGLYRDGHSLGRRWSED